jgi:HPt (histidine-containing phosphotransfer) domain-containing protein
MSTAVNTVDYEQLRKQAAGNLGVMREVLQLFLTHCEQVLGELDRAADEQTWKLWTHTLKGSAGGVGAFAVAKAAADAERHMLDKSKLEPLKVAYAEAKAFIAANPL